MSDLQRYGLEWKSEKDFVCQPMDDGYWTPWHIATNELTRLQSEIERLQRRCGELESGLEGIANCAYGYNHPKAQTADEAASWMNGEAMRLLGDPQPSAWLLRKQAEAVERCHEVAAEVDSICSHNEEMAAGADCMQQEICNALDDYAQRLRQQAAESEHG